MKILIFGGSGFLGKIQYQLCKNHKVTVLIKKFKNFRKYNKFIKGNI